MSTNRLDYWANFITERGVRSVVEVGVWRGEYAAHMLATCPSIEKYYLIDPWQMLDDWNKPLNSPDLEDAYRQTVERMAPFGDKVVFLRGKTADVAAQLPGDIDFAYIDGDHTLRGVVVDMLKIWPHLRTGGWLAGDDLSPSIWQHSRKFEPTMVFPFAVHFAEGMGCPMVSPISSQFYITKDFSGFRFEDLEKAYPGTDILPQITGTGTSLLRRIGLG